MKSRRQHSGTVQPPKWRSGIRAVREAKGLTQTELSQLERLAPWNLGLIESGHRVPTVATLFRILGHFACR
jgi:transcriptional regulator with XRE-family HTH domain